MRLFYKTLIMVFAWHVIGKVTRARYEVMINICKIKWILLKNSLYRKYILKDSCWFGYEYNNISEDEFVNLDMGLQQINDLVVTSCIILSFHYIHLFSEFRVHEHRKAEHTINVYLISLRIWSNNCMKIGNYVSHDIF